MKILNKIQFYKIYRKEVKKISINVTIKMNINYMDIMNYITEDYNY